MADLTRFIPRLTGNAVCKPTYLRFHRRELSPLPVKAPGQYGTGVSTVPDITEQQAAAAYPQQRTGRKTSVNGSVIQRT